MPWLATWARAVVAPATTRALPVWLGAGIAGAVVFGGTGMAPRDLTRPALHVPGIGGVLAGTWLLVFLPVARVLVRADGARFLRSLPGAPGAARALAAVALIALQLPWLVLWLAGAGLAGAGVVVALSVPLAALAAWRPPQPRIRAPRWPGTARALAGIHLRALRRRAGDALVRGAGLAVLAGVAGGLFVANNSARGAGPIAGAAVIAVVLVPAWAGALLPLAVAHRDSGWLAGSLGVPEATRVGVLAAIVAALYAAGAALAIAAAALAGARPVLPLAAATLALALATSPLAARAVVSAAASPVAGSRVAIGAIVATAVSVVALGAFGAAGLAALAAVGALALGTVRA